ncbi:MAG: phosphate/phosphite/phosphonate ABC transporter substrate-binding protein [Bacillota bacterium]
MIRQALAALLGLLLLVGCGTGAKEKDLRVMVIPTQAGEAFETAMTRLERELSSRSGLPVKVTIGTDYAAVVEALRFGKIEAAYFGPFTYVVASAQSGARAFATMQIKGKPYYHSYMIVPKDSPITQLTSPADFTAQVKGKRFAFADAGSTSGSLVPRLALKRAGLNWESDVKYTFTGHHDAVLAAVAGGKAEIGAVDSAIFEGQLREKMPAEFAKVRVVWQSEPLYQYPWAARGDLDPKLVHRLQKAFLEIEDREILSALGGADRFVTADDAQYAPIREAATEMGIDLKRYSLKKK